MGVFNADLGSMKMVNSTKEHQSVFFNTFQKVSGNLLIISGAFPVLIFRVKEKNLV